MPNKVPCTSTNYHPPLMKGSPFFSTSLSIKKMTSPFKLFSETSVSGGLTQSHFWSDICYNIQFTYEFPVGLSLLSLIWFKSLILRVTQMHNEVEVKQNTQKLIICDALCDLVPFVQFKKSEKHSWGELILVKLQASVCIFTKINTPPWVFFTFFKLHKWYQIAQRITYEFAW